MARVLDTVTMPIKKNGVATPQEYVNNPTSTAPQFSASTAYVVGQYVFYNKKLYRFKAAHAAGAWNSAHVDEVTVASELNAHGADLTQLKADLAQVETGAKSAYIYDTASGAIASFDDGADGVPVKDLTVQIEPVQDLHGQSNPYPGGGGSNKFDYTDIHAVGSKAYGLSMTNNNDGTITISGTLTGMSSGATYVQFRCFYIKAASISKYSGFKYYYFRTSGSNGVGTSGFTIGSDGSVAITVYGNEADSVNVTVAIYGIDSSTRPDSFSPYANICPISGWTGANVGKAGYYHRCMPTTDYPVGYAIGSANGVTLYYEGHGKYRVKGTATAQADISVPIYEFTTQPNTIDTRLLRLNNQKQTVLLIFYLGTSLLDSTTLSSAADRTMKYNVLADKTINRIVVRVASGDTVDCTFMPEFIDTAGESTYPITFPTEAGTVYGGTLDVTSGVLTVDRASVDLGSLTWNYRESTIQYFYSPATAEQNMKEYAARTAPLICSSYLTISDGREIASVPDKSIYSANIGVDGYSICVKDTAYGSDAVSFKTAMNGVQLCYPLATPQTYQLTPQEVSTLLGLNNIWADCGDVEVEYRADTKLYIEKLTAPTEDDMVANTNIPSDTYFMIGNTLFLSTTTIPAGDTINPGTNCTLMNLAAALNAINA